MISPDVAVAADLGSVTTVRGGERSKIPTWLSQLPILVT